MTGKVLLATVALAVPAFACTTIVAGKNATVTGHVILGHNEDDRGNFQVFHAFVPRRTFAKGVRIPAEKGRAEIPQIGETLGFYWAEVNGGSVNPSFADVFMNEKGVAIVSNNGRGKPNKDESQLVEGGLAWALRRAVAERATSARHAVDVITNLVSVWGYAAPGRIYTVADKDEAWIVELVYGRRHFVARRVADDEVALIPNAYTIRTFLPGDVLSPVLAAQGAGFDFAREFQWEEAWKVPHSQDRMRNMVRIFTGRDWPSDDYPFSVKPAAKVDAALMEKALSSHYEGTPDEVPADAQGLRHAEDRITPICRRSTVGSTVFEFAAVVADTRAWFCAGSPCRGTYRDFYPLKALPADIDASADAAARLEAHPRPPANRLVRSPYAVNVKDFGAVGDGVHDDTAALQRAADSVAGAARENGRLDYLSKYQVSMLIDGPVREIWFPRGCYKITGPVVFEGSTTLRGSEAAIVNETADKDSFFFSKALRVDVEGFAFSGGRTQLRQWTRNRDISSARIVNCRFRGASDTALALDGWALVGKDGKRGEYAAPHVAERGADGLFALVDRPQGTIRQTANSTLIFVDRCEFRDNRRSIYAHSDGVNIRRCRFFASPAVPADAFVKVATRAHMSNLEFFSEGAVAGRRAVDLGQGTIVADNMRIVAPRGMEAFRSTIKTTAWERDEVFGVGYWLRDITLDTAGSPLLTIGESRLPEMVAIKGVRRAGSSSGRKKLFDFTREFSEEELAAWTAKARHRQHGVEGVFGWAAEGFDEKDFELGVPASLMRLRHPAGCGVKRDVEFTETDIPGGKVFTDSAIGRDSCKEKGDDTDRIEALMRKAAAAGGGTVMLPPRWIDVSRTIAVPRSVRITAPGRAVVRAVAKDVVLFRADDAPDAFFENIAFSGGACAVASAAAEGRLRFAGCIFAGQSSNSIKTVSQGVSRLRVEAQFCLSFTPSLYDGNAAPALFDAFWFESSPSFDKTAWQSAKPKSHCGMVNRAGGVLRLYDMLGVPCVYWYVKKYDYFTWQPERNAHPELFGDFRWVDNHGDLACVNFRYGGEWGGMTPVYQYGDKAKTVIAGPIVGGHLCAWLRAGNASVLSDREEANVTLDEVFYTTCLANPATVMWRTPDGSLREAKGWTKANCYPHER